VVGLDFLVFIEASDELRGLPDLHIRVVAQKVVAWGVRGVESSARDGTIAII